MGDGDRYSLSAVEERFGLQTIEADISEELASASATDTAKGLTKKLTLECTYAAVFAAVVGAIAYVSMTVVGETPTNYTSLFAATFAIFYTKGIYCTFGSAERARETERPESAKRTERQSNPRN